MLFSPERGLKQKDGESESHKQTLKTFRHESLKVIRVGGSRGGRAGGCLATPPKPALRRKSPFDTENRKFIVPNIEIYDSCFTYLLINVICTRGVFS